MARYPAGQPVRISTTVRDVTGALVDPATHSLVAKVAAADGTLTTTGTYTSPVRDSLGTFHQDVPVTDLAALGHYKWVWTTTGTGAGVARGTFDVYDPFEDTVLELQDAKDMLNIAQTVTKYDAEIQSWIDSIESSLEASTGGPVTNRQVTERAEATAGLTRICLRQRPLVSVTSITAESSGAAVSITDLSLDKNAGIIQRATGWPFYGPFFWSQPWFNVVYVAGWGTAVPAAFTSFARIVVDHLWQVMRMPVSLPMGGEEAVPVPGFSFLIPARAAELLEGSVNGVPFLQEAYL